MAPALKTPVSDRRAKLARAREYPYEIPAGSYIWRGGAVAPFDPAARRGRLPVLAVGSNQSPRQLSRKFGDQGEIPVQRAHLADFDIFYSAHITAYGSVPAMLQRSPGTEVTLSLTWLDDRQLEAMHATELSAAKYEFAVIENIDLALDCGATLNSVHLYAGVNGHLVNAGDAVALAAIAAEGRRFKALDTAGMLEIVRRRVAPAEDPDEFVLKLVDDQAYRAACTDRIATDSVTFGHPARPVWT